MYVFKINWIACSKYDNHPKIRSQDNWKMGGGEIYMAV